MKKNIYRHDQLSEVCTYVHTEACELVSQKEVFDEEEHKQNSYPQMLK